MIARCLILAALVAGMLGVSSTAASAGVSTKRVCVLVNDDPTTHAWDGVCVWVPIN